MHANTRSLEPMTMKKLPGFLFCVAALVAGQSVSALQLGQVVVESTRGQTLSAYVVLFGAPPADGNALGVEVLPAFGIDGTDIRGRVVVEGDNVRIALDSATPVVAAELGLRIRLRDGRTSRVQSYTLRLPPPAAPSRPFAVRSETSRAQLPERTRRSRAPAPARTNKAGSVGSVRPGQTLWGILQQQGLADGDVAARMRAVVDANPEAFADHDPNRLRVGAMLDLTVLGNGSTATEASGASTQPSTIEVKDTTPKPRVDIARPAEAAPLDAETLARLAALSEKFAAIRARYAAQQQHATGQSGSRTTSDVSAPATTTAQLPATTEGGKTNALPASSAALPSKVTSNSNAATRGVPQDATAATPRSPSPTAPVAAADTDESSDHSTRNMGIALGVAMALALLAAGGVTALRALARRRARRSGQLSNDRDLVAEISRKTEQRLQLEDEVKRMVAGRRDAERAPSPPPSVIERAIARGTDVASVEEIESRIAHGQYNEAESMLEQVIAATPGNFRAKLRLAEIYYLNERHEEFVELAEEIYSRHRSDIGDENWQRVMRMGKMVAPDRPPFSGPVAVSGARQHG